MNRAKILAGIMSDPKKLAFFVETIKDELNVKDVQLVFGEDADKYVRPVVLPDFKSIGIKFRSLVPKIKAALAVADAKKIAVDLSGTGHTTLKIDGQDVVLSKEDIKVHLEIIDQGGTLVGSALEDHAILIDTTLTPDLIEEGVVNEIIFSINRLRKELKIPYTNRIGFKIVCNSVTGQACLKHARRICEETLSVEVYPAVIEGNERNLGDGEFKVTMTDWGRSTEKYWAENSAGAKPNEADTGTEEAPSVQG